ncbi:hypothetical protein EI94DRAFT_1638093 [Lactarius quietus]|nr:hypothetical protein EI94DRAFT_1638093 [Lactarius quietus]
MKVLIALHTCYNTADIKALVDSGATDNFVSARFLREMGIKTRPLEKPKKIYNINNSKERLCHITSYVILKVVVAGEAKEMHFLVTDIRSEDILFGYPWLAAYEPRFK